MCVCRVRARVPAQCVPAEMCAKRCCVPAEWVPVLVCEVWPSERAAHTSAGLLRGTRSHATGPRLRPHPQLRAGGCADAPGESKFGI
eukprot:scaffold145460_cov127-Phaeocystis_antarctica.AAC.2